MVDNIDWDIKGDTFDYLEVHLGPYQKLYSNSRRLLGKDPAVGITTEAQGGFWEALKRSLFFGEPFFLVEYDGGEKGGDVTLKKHRAGDILPLELESGMRYILRDGAYMASTGHLKREARIPSLKGGLFGRQGLVFQEVYTDAPEGITVFLETYGDLVKIDLKPGEKYQIDPTHLVAWESHIKYSAEILRPRKRGLWDALKTWLFGEKLIVATLEAGEEGGKIYLQSDSVFSHRPYGYASYGYASSLYG